MVCCLAESCTMIGVLLMVHLPGVLLLRDTEHGENMIKKGNSLRQRFFPSVLLDLSGILAKKKFITGSYFISGVKFLTLNSQIHLAIQGFIWQAIIINDHEMNARQATFKLIAVDVPHMNYDSNKKLVYKVGLLSATHFFCSNVSSACSRKSKLQLTSGNISSRVLNLIC